MSILFYCDWPNKKTWIYQLKKKFHNEKIYIWPNIKKNDKAIKYAIVWDIPRGNLKNLTNLKAIFSLGAGVDHLLNDHDLPKVPIVRLKDPQLAKRMSNFVQCHIYNFQLNTHKYIENKKNRFWSNEFGMLDNNDLTIGILGLGYIGSHIANDLIKKGYKVQGFKRTRSSNNNKILVYYSKNQLKKFISTSDVIVSILPNTLKTNNFIDSKFFNNMKKKSLIINIGRGSTLDETAIMNHAKKNKSFSGVLDVFKQEPLKKRNPLWKQKNIIITPHVAGVTNIKTAINQIYEIYSMHKKEGKLKNLVNWRRKY